jgi:hypothetical protein
MFLAADSWASVPYQFSAKSSQELLLDITLQIPGLLERADRIKLYWHAEEYSSEAQQFTDGSSSPATWYSQAVDYLQDCDALIRKLNDWLKSLQESENGPLWWYSQNESDAYQSSTIHFSSPRIPGLLIYYWTGLLELSTAVLEIGSQLHHGSHQNISCGTPNFDYSSTSGDASMPNKLALRICQTAMHLAPSLESRTMIYIPVKLAENYFMRLISSDFQMQYKGNSHERQSPEEAQIDLEYSREVLKRLQNSLKPN